MRNNATWFCALTDKRTGNNFFTRLTGLAPDEIKRLTLFSIVHVEKLSNLFELVAEAMRNSHCSSDLANAATLNQSATEVSANDTSSCSNSICSSIGDESTDKRERTSSCSNGAGTLESLNVEMPLRKRAGAVDYTAMTLPCVDFSTPLKSKTLDKRRERKKLTDGPLYMTVSQNSLFLHGPFRSGIRRP